MNTMNKLTLLDLPEDILDKITGYVEDLKRIENTKIKQAFTIWKCMSKFRLDDEKLTGMQLSPSMCGYYDKQYDPKFYKSRIVSMQDPDDGEEIYHQEIDDHPTYDLTDDQVDEYLFGYQMRKYLTKKRCMHRFYSFEEDDGDDEWDD